MYQAVPHSRPALLTVVVAHVAAALLFVQIMEARRYIEPAPLSVTLLPEIQEPAPAPPSDPVPEPAPPQFQPPVPLPMMPAPEPVREVRLEPDPVWEPVAEPEPVQEPLPPVRLEPEPIIREVIPEPLVPIPLPKPEPLQKTVVEPPQAQKFESLPKPPPPAPEPSSRAITEIAIPPVPHATPAAVPVVQPQPVPVAAPPPPPMMATRPAQLTTAAPEQDDIVMDSRVLTAVYLSNPKPLYPNVSRRLGEQGTVLLRVFVTVAGEPAQIELKSSSGFPRLDRAALNAVRSWKFSPATRSDQAVDAWVLVPIRFSLKG